MNGFISFNRAYYGKPSRPLYASRLAPIIAPFFADIDSRHPSYASVYISQHYILHPSPLTMAVLKNASIEVNRYQWHVRNFPDHKRYGLFDKIVPNFQATLVTIITWDKVVPFPSPVTNKYGKTHFN